MSTVNYDAPINEEISLSLFKICLITIKNAHLAVIPSPQQPVETHTLITGKKDISINK
jgi:hypothetical protein